LALSLARGALGRMARFVRYAPPRALGPGLRYRPCPWRMLAEHPIGPIQRHAKRLHRAPAGLQSP